MERVATIVKDKGHKNSNCLFGRYECIRLTSEGLLHIVVADDMYPLLSWLVLKIEVNNLDKVKQWALRDKGTLFVDLNEQGVGFIVNKPLE